MADTRLKAYIDTQNVWRDLFPNSKVKTLEMPKTSEQAEELQEMIESDLSPENLCCDGELGGEQLRDKAALLNAAFAECEILIRDLP